MSEDIEKISDEFYDSFLSTHVLLYVGNNVDWDEVKNYISSVPWSAIITTNQNQEKLAMLAAQSGGLQTCKSTHDFSTRYLSRKKPLLIPLYGIEGDIEDDRDAAASISSPFNKESRKIRKANEFLSSLPSLLDGVNRLAVTGIDSPEDIALLDHFSELLEGAIAPGSVSFWGMENAFVDDSDLKEWLKKICEQKYFSFNSVSLREVIELRSNQISEALQDIPVPTSTSDVFFCNHKSINIDSDKLLRVKSIGTLMTERSVYRIRPLGSSERKMWFSSFLELSGIGEPQWYGYFPQSDFYVKREHEEALVHLVRRALKGQGIKDDVKESRPILLSGAPGSSKSVCLGSLAYRIYNEKNNPVLFISGEMALGSSSSNAFRNIVDALEVIHSLSSSATPILVIWDGSSYREIENEANRLLTSLKNRGRNVVLVCSSYALGEATDDIGYTFDYKSGAFRDALDQEKADVIARSRCLLVKADRMMSEREQNSFWQKAQRYSGIDDIQISFLQKKLAEEQNPDIFDYYYKLVSLLRARLEASLGGEQDKVTRFLEEERPTFFEELKLKKKEDQEHSPMWQAFLDAGMTEEELSVYVDEDKNDDIEDNWNKQLKRANAFIALFSRYKIDVPYSFIYGVIVRSETENPYGEFGSELFNILTTRIPWLFYGENENEEFVLRYRNSLEAKLFLDRHHIDGKKLVEMAVEVLDYYGKVILSHQYDNPRLASKLQLLVRLMGPNSKFYNSKRDNSEVVLEHKDIRSHLNELIDIIEKLLNEYRVPDGDFGFSLLLVTLTREYYGHNVWNDMHGIMPNQPNQFNAKGFTSADYVKRFSKIANASSRALSREQLIEDQLAVERDSSRAGFLRSQANGLTVESALCDLEIKELYSQYSAFCADAGLGEIDASVIHLQPYSLHFQKLAAAINSDPFNGYAYNALFSLFENEYQREDGYDEQKIEHLTEIMTHVDACLVYDNEIESRGARWDELSNHITQIKSFADDVPATLDLIENRGQGVETRDTSAFLEIYDRYLEQGNPAAILFIAQKEINQVTCRERLNESEIERCKKVLDFMTEENRYSCVCSDQNALAFLIRTTWMAFTGTDLNAAKECQTTALHAHQWGELFKYCKAYSKVASPTTQKPILILLYALAALQIGDGEGRYEAAYSIIREIGEEQFTTQYRMRTPFMLCDENGEPFHYSARVARVNERNGRMRVTGVPTGLGRNGSDGVYFRQAGLGRNAPMPNEGELFTNLELGVGYMGFSMFTKQGRMEIGRQEK